MHFVAIVLKYKLNGISGWQQRNRQPDVQRWRSVQPELEFGDSDHSVRRNRIERRRKQRRIQSGTNIKFCSRKWPSKVITHLSNIPLKNS